MPSNLQEHIRRVAAENPIWGEARIADELRFKLGIRVSPRTVGKYLSGGRGPRRTPDPKQRWMTFVRNHDKGIHQHTAALAEPIGIGRIQARKRIRGCVLEPLCKTLVPLH